MPYKNPLKGVYAIKVRGRLHNYIYIGSSSNIKHRYTLHLLAIKKSDTKRYVRLLHDLYHEGHLLELVVLELCEDIVVREQYWLNFYKNDVSYRVINVFDADRKNSSITEEFREKMSAIRKEKWKDQSYRQQQLEKLKPTQFKKGSV